MKRRGLVLVACLLVSVACDSRGGSDAQVIPPSSIVDFDVLYARNCSGCHGKDGKGGLAIGLSDPVYLAIADDATIRRVTANGVPGTPMPAFAQQAGGMLTEGQIDVIIKGIRARWGKASGLHDVPSYAGTVGGDAARGAAVYSTFCQSCHGAQGRGSERASSIVDGSYLTLVSDQNLRTTVIAGRPELGAPDWRGNVAGKPMSAEDVNDVVAWLAAQRPQFAGKEGGTQ